MEITTKEYTLLFNAVIDAIDKLDALKAELILAQQQAEEIVISKDDSTANE